MQHHWSLQVLQCIVQEEIEELRVKLQHVSNVAEQEINKLKSELSKVGEQFRSAEQAYLPLWTIPYYDEAAKHASAARDHAISYYDKVWFFQTRKGVIQSGKLIALMNNQCVCGHITY